MKLLHPRRRKRDSLIFRMVLVARDLTEHPMNFSPLPPPSLPPLSPLSDVGSRAKFSFFFWVKMARTKRSDLLLSTKWP